MGTKKKASLKQVYYFSFLALIVLPIVVVFVVSLPIIHAIVKQQAIENIHLAQANIIANLTSEVQEMSMRLSHLVYTNDNEILNLVDWSLQNITNGADEISELGTFYLPVRASKADPYNVIVQGDSFMGVTTHSKNPELAKAFVEWFYSDAWYPEYISYVSSATSMANFPKDKDPILAESDENCPDMSLVMYDGGGDSFTAIQNETSFDYKKLGAQMLTPGFNLDKALGELNAKWSAARTKLGIK